VLGTDKASVMRSLNDGVTLFAADAPTAAGETETWAFVCECCAVECDAWVELELAEYDAIRAAPDSTILAAGHVAPSYPERLRREATNLREEVRALREQSKLQLTRTRRQLRRARRSTKYP
jgi:hypothetical protein